MISAYRMPNANPAPNSAKDIVKTQTNRNLFLSIPNILNSKEQYTR